MITRQPFAKHHQQDVSLFVLENDQLKVSILDYGAIITSIIYKPLLRETALGFTSLRDYYNQSAYLGAVVGRIGNRIRDGRFTLEGQAYEVPKNGPHHLHGGPNGYDQRIFDSDIQTDALVLTLNSPDGDQGYPGNLKLQIVYSLSDASLVISTSAICDQTSLVDPTQHTYFNLNADHAQSILNHQLKLNSDLLYEIDEDGCTGSSTLKTIHTPFDFTQRKPLKEAMDFSHPQIQRVEGIDHYFLKHDLNNPLFCEFSVDDLTLRVTTSHPGAHVYAGNYLKPLENGSVYPFLIPFGGICFETQHVPNSINFDLTQAPILQANTRMSSTTTYAYSQGNPDENPKL